MEENPKAKAALIEAINEQIASPETPYVGKHYKRLLNEGHEEDDVLELLASILAAEMWEMTTQARGFNEKQYIERLEKLPDLSWMDQG